MAKTGASSSFGIVSTLSGLFPTSTLFMHCMHNCPGLICEPPCKLMILRYNNRCKVIERKWYDRK